jgi:hypothetical protein
MNQIDLDAFNKAVALAQNGQTDTAYRQFLSITPRNYNDPNLLARLIFIAPTYQDKIKWVEQARLVASSNAAVQAALNWFAQQPKPTPVVTAPPPPDFYRSSASPNYQPTTHNFVTPQTHPQAQFQEPHHQQQFSYAPVPPGQPKQASVIMPATSSNLNQSALSNKTKAKNFSKGIWLLIGMAVLINVIIILLLYMYMLR